MEFALAKSIMYKVNTRFQLMKCNEKEIKLNCKSILDKTQVIE